MDNYFIAISHIEKKDKDTILNSFQKVSKTFYYKFKSLNLSKYELKSSDFVELKFKYEGFLYKIKNVMYKPTNKKCLQIKYSISSDENYMINLVRFHATNIHPAIVTFIGYFKEEDDKYSISIIVNDNSYNILHDYIKSEKILRLNLTEKLIIAYGVASALEFFHSHNIVIRDFKPSNILLDSQFYPYFFFFITSKNIDDIQYSEENLICPPILTAPEVLERNADANLFLNDVYAYGLFLYHIITQKKPFKQYKSPNSLLDDIKKGARPQFPDLIPSTWKNLIERCWSQDCNDRPTFTEICDILESSTFVNSSINIVAFNDYKKIIKPYGLE